MIEKRLVTSAVAALLGTATALPVGKGSIPRTSTGFKAPPYYVLAVVDVTVPGAPYADEHEDIEIVYQVTSVSGPVPGQSASYGTLEQAEGLADKARQALIGRDPATGLWLHSIDLTGASCTCRELETEPGATNDPADGIISYVQRFRLGLTTA
ncbi:hypothetical protein [Streptomyces capuensis]|uniref:hypothetical protein n=1 Tax=Streptomyces capuensis TaxID=1464056 RepID=UPI0004C055B5|nr:hypothetical protein [Streptomyces capuensis]